MSSRTYTLLPAGARTFHDPRPSNTKYVNQHGQRRAQRNSYPSRDETGPLDKGQKAHLCILAREAFEAVRGRAPVDGHEMDAWRREEQRKATGLLSLIDVDQRHWAELKAHFLNLKGESGQALKALVQPADLGERQKAMAVLRKNCRELKLDMAYPAAICRAQNKCELDDASPRQIWRLVFTVRNRGRKKMQDARGCKMQGMQDAESPF